MSALLPPALLLLWSGTAAIAIVSLVLAPLLGESPGALAWSPQRTSVPQTLLLGSIVLPVVYGCWFAALGEANLVTGGLLGLVHAAAFGFRSFRSGGRALLRRNEQRLLLCIGYGALLGFAYITP